MVRCCDAGMPSRSFQFGLLSGIQHDQEISKYHSTVSLERHHMAAPGAIGVQDLGGEKGSTIDTRPKPLAFWEYQVTHAQCVWSGQISVACIHTLPLNDAKQKYSNYRCI